MDDRYCSIVSQELAEPIYGQALSANVWFLLEVNQPWGAQATTENTLPLTVQTWLNNLETAVPHSRIQFIRQIPGAKRAFFVAVVDEAAPRLYRFAFDQYETLFDLDIPAVIAGDAAFAAQRWSSPLFLVCTNGKRDRCCARFGAAVYRALQVQVGSAVWQTTHVGGHRFAPNIVTFPDGIFYSRVYEQDVSALVTAVQQNNVALSFYRGRTCYRELEQAADYFLRQETGRLGVRDFRHVATVTEVGGAWVRFADADGTLHEVRLGMETAVPAGLLASCGKPQSKPLTRYVRIGCEVIS